MDQHLMYKISQPARMQEGMQSRAVLMSRVEDGRGGYALKNPAPFSVPAHQTGRADFQHPAFRLTLPYDPRRASICRNSSRAIRSSRRSEAVRSSKKAMPPTLIISSAARMVAEDRMSGPIRVLMAWRPKGGRGGSTTPPSNRLPCWKTRCST